MSLAGKRIFITGGSRGIGLAIALRAAQDGALIAIAAKTAEANPKLPGTIFSAAKEIEAAGGTALPLQCDIRDEEQIAAAIEKTAAEFGGIDILINNAGMGITGAIEETPTDEMRNVFETNFFGAIEMMKAVLPQMRKQNSGLIINVTSIAGYMGLPFRGIYSATKGALEIVTEAIRMEVKGFGIEVTNVAPGDFATNIASGRFHTPIFYESPYKKNYQKNLDLMDKHVDSGSNPIQMAEAIFNIINTPKPEIHYKVGDFMQKFSII